MSDEHPAERWARESRDERHRRLYAALAKLPDPPEPRATTEEWTTALAGVAAAVSVEEMLDDLIEWHAERAADLEERLAILAIDRDELRRQLGEQLRER